MDAPQTYCPLRGFGIIPRVIRRVLASALFALAGLAPAPAGAQSSLDAGNPAEVNRALDTLAREGGRDAVQRIAERIERGLPPALLARAIRALTTIADRWASRALIDLGQHRRASVRAQVAESLGALGREEARSALANLLDDPDPRVRSQAAVALGQVGAAPVINTLIQAALRGVPEAAIVVGQQARPGDVARLMGQVDAETFPAIAPALRILLGRANLPRPGKIRIVRRIGEVIGTDGGGTDQVRLLREVSATLSSGDPLQSTIQEVLDQLSVEEE